MPLFRPPKSLVTQRKDYISKEYILSLGSEEDIFNLVFGYEPVPFEYVTSPFREDFQPGCWFEYSYNGKLIFKDFGDVRRPKNRDCFDAVMDYYGHENLYQTMVFLTEYFESGELISPHIPPGKYKSRIPKPGMVEIIPHYRTPGIQDKNYLVRYGITRANLLQDKVYPLSHYLIRKPGELTKRINCRRPVYAITGFKHGRVKIYDPKNPSKKHRFVTNCTPDDLGHVWDLVTPGEQLVIATSWKDYRVLKNYGLNCIWVQAESAIPSLDVLIKYCNPFRKVVIFGDNDAPGIAFATKLSQVINDYTTARCRPVWLPETLRSQHISDPADMVDVLNRQHLLSFLKSKAIK